jgi:protein phosphatase
MHITWAAATHPGMRRSSNEDSYSVQESLGLFVVADGMGGHVAGEVASRLAVDTIERFVRETAGPDRDRTWPFPFEASLSYNGNRLSSAFRLANRRISEEAAADAALRGMATTASALLVREGDVPVVAHVGDSRVYHFKGGALRRVTVDHSWVEEQVRAGVLDAETASHHPWRNVVTRALAGGTDPQVDVTEIALGAGDWVILCSDGLSSVVTDERIAQAVAAATAPQALCDQLVELANGEGGPDNVTIIAVFVNAA